MALTSGTFFFVLLSVLLLSVPNDASIDSRKLAQSPLGGWTPIVNLKDPTVVEIAKFAVAQHNEEKKTALGFVDVIKGETQVVAGTNYRLVIAAKDGAAAAKNYQAVVWSKAWQKFKALKLISFQEV